MKDNHRDKKKIKPKVNRKMSSGELQDYLKHKKQSNVHEDKSKFRRKQKKPKRFYETKQ